MKTTPFEIVFIIRGAMKKMVYLRETHEREFAQVFQSITSHSAWSVWTDFVELFAIALANVMETGAEVHSRREAQFAAIVKTYDEPELEMIKNLCRITVEALEDNPQQDFLGELYMGLDFGNSWRGQYFTPWNIAYMMAQMTMGAGDISEKGYVSVCDSACGAGCMLIAAAAAYRNESMEEKNYQTDLLFVGQDVDRVVALMCYIQLALLGCAGYVIVGNSLTEPPCGDELFPVIGKQREIWYTPMWNSPLWLSLRIKQTLALRSSNRNEESSQTESKEKGDRETV